MNAADRARTKKMMWQLNTLFLLVSSWWVSASILFLVQWSIYLAGGVQNKALIVALTSMDHVINPFCYAASNNLVREYMFKLISCHRKKSARNSSLSTYQTPNRKRRKSSFETKVNNPFETLTTGVFRITEERGVTPRRVNVKALTIAAPLMPQRFDVEALATEAPPAGRFIAPSDSTRVCSSSGSLDSTANTSLCYGNPPAPLLSPCKPPVDPPEMVLY